MNIWKSKKVIVQVEGSVNAILPATYEIVPPMVAPTTFPASNVPIADVGNRYVATEAETALQEIAGSGRTTETVKDNADDIANLAGTGRTTETVKGNADAITSLQTATYKKIDATGDLLYGSAADALARLPIGATNKVLTVVAGLPSWADIPPVSDSSGRILPSDYGCVMDGVTDDTTNFQAAVNAAIADKKELFIPPGYNILLSSPITISAAISIVGGGAQTCLLTFDDCSAFAFANGVIADHMRGFTIQLAVAYTTTVNAHKGILVAGDTTHRPYWCIFEDLVIIGFETAIEANWIWASTFTNIQTAYCHKGLVIKGLSVNNKVDGNSQFAVDGSTGSRGIVIGDGTNEIEGWWLNQVMAYDADVGIELVGANHIYTIQPILDMCHSNGIHLRDAGGHFASNISVHGGYIAFSANGEAGIKLENNTDHAQIRGAEIIGVEIIAYTGSHFDYGILTSGAYCRNNIIGNNKIKNLDTAHVDIYMNGGGDNVIAGNVCLSPTPDPNNIYIAAGTGNKIYGNIGTCNVGNAL